MKFFPAFKQFIPRQEVPSRASRVSDSISWEAYHGCTYRNWYYSRNFWTIEYYRLQAAGLEAGRS